MTNLRRKSKRKVKLVMSEEDAYRLIVQPYEDYKEDIREFVALYGADLARKMLGIKPGEKW